MLKHTSLIATQIYAEMVPKSRILRIKYPRIHIIYRGKRKLFKTKGMAVTKYCNKIFVMENGKITESGSHDELIAKRGIYYDMYRKQIETYDEKVFDMD